MCGYEESPETHRKRFSHQTTGLMKDLNFGPPNAICRRISIFIMGNDDDDDDSGNMTIAYASVFVCTCVSTSLTGLSNCNRVELTSDVVETIYSTICESCRVFCTENNEEVVFEMECNWLKAVG